jgi:hypothetical protein
MRCVVEFDFSELRAEIARVEIAQSREKEAIGAGGLVHIFANALSHKIGKTLKPYLDQVTPDTSTDILQEMDFLYTKMIFLSPHASLGHIVKGQFQGRSGQFAKAAESFQSAYDIERDPTRPKWPHLQATERNARLMVSLGHSLYHSGQVEEGERFWDAGQQMLAKIKTESPTEKPPEPL